MRLADIIVEARVRLDDATKGADGILSEVLWSTDRLKSWANEGHIEACRRTRYLKGNKTLKLTAGKASYSLPANVIALHRAKVQGEERALIFSSSQELDCCHPDWETHTGIPSHIITDIETGKFSVYPAPENDGVLVVTAVFEPDILADETDIPSRYAYGIVDWVLFRAYQVPDTDMFNIDASQRHRAYFDEEFGKKSSALDEIYNSRNRPFDLHDGHY